MSMSKHVALHRCSELPVLSLQSALTPTENAVQDTKTLYNIIKQPLLPSTIQFHFKKTGIKAVVKSKCHFLFVEYCYKLSSPRMTMSWPSLFHSLIPLLRVCALYFSTWSSHFTLCVLPGGQTVGKM